MKRGLVAGLAALAVCALTVSGCTTVSGTPTPSPQTSSATSTASSTPAGTAPPSTTAGSTSVPDDPALDVCDDLGVLPCARQVNRVTLPIAGSSIALLYSSDRQAGRAVDEAPSATDVGLGGWSLSDLPGYDPGSGREILPDGTLRTVTGVKQGDLTAVADPSGQTVTTFDAQGRATATMDALTGAPIVQFSWDTHGLSAVTDASGPTITVQRDASGAPISLQVTGTSPMTLSTASGALQAIGYPDGGIVALDPGTGGLLNDITDATGLSTRFSYDEQGRLISRTDPTGIVSTYRRAAGNGSATVTTSVDGSTIATDTVTTGGTGTTFSHTDATGVTTTVADSGTTRTITSALRTFSVTLAPDPRWGTDAPIPASVTATQTGGAGPGTSVSTTRSASGSTTTSTAAVDGKEWTYATDSTARTTTVTDPNGMTRTTTLDDRGRVVSTTVQSVPVAYRYDDSGRVVAITVGTGTDARTWTYAYTPGTIAVTDPVGDKSVQTVNAVGVVTAVAGPVGTGETTTVDTAAHITGFAAAGAGTYAVTWGANGLPAAVNAPAGQGSPQFTATTYDPTGLPATRTTADATVTYGRDPAGRLTTIGSGGNSSIAFTYDTSGRLTTAASPGVTLNQTYAGPALSATSTTIGAVKTTVGRTADDRGRTTTLSINGGASISYTYDAAGRVTTAGAMTITRDPKTGWITTKKLGTLTESFSYNQFGEPVGITVAGPAGTVAAIAEQRDHLGRVVGRTTTTGSAHHTTSYAYDAAGRLVAETDDGAKTSYGYDTAGNIVSATSPSGTTKNTYDARNELVSSGSTVFGYDGSGQLATAKAASGTTTYHYDALGNLTGVDVAGKPAVAYTVDPLNRRVARSSGGETSSAIAYLDSQRPAATFTASGAVDEVYVYDGDLQPANINDGGGLLPAYLTKGGTAYLEVPDPSGGPALVIDSATGAVADAVDRTALGAVRSETHPGFQVIGFGGGISDPATSLVRFGARDYDTATGRWTAPDPLGIAGGSANLYAFVSGDPVNRTDPRGTCDYTSIGISASAGLGPIAGGGSIGIAWGGGQFGTYVTGSEGVGAGGDLSIGVTGSCLNSDNGDTSLGNFSGSGTSVEGQVGPVSGGSDTGYDSSGKQSSHGGHVGVGAGVGLGGSAQGTFTSIVCLFGCPPPPVTVCGDLGCDSSPGNSAQNPGSSGSSGGIPTSGPRSTGDPHIHTADGGRYDMMAVGEFTWATVDSGTDSGDMTVQIRQQPAKDSRTVSINTAIAIAIDGATIEITPPPAAGQPVGMTVTGATIPPIGTFPIAGGATVMRTPTLTTITAKDATEFWIRMNPSGLDIVAAFPAADQGKIHGLVGPFGGSDSGAGSSASSVQTASGQTIAIEDLRGDYDTLYRTFADSWRVTQSASLFTDKPGDATAFNDPTFPDRTPPAVPADLAATAKAACEAAGLTGADLADCELDITSTGDTGYAASTAAASGLVPGLAPTGGTENGGTGGTGGAVSGDIVPGKTVTGTVAASSKTSYLFTVPAGTVGYFAADPACKDVNDVIWTIQDAAGSGVTGPSVICADIGRIVFPAAGSYRLVVTNSGSASAQFAVTWKESRPDIVKPLQAGQTASGTIDKPGAHDVWTMTVTAGEVAYLAADPACSSASGDAILWNLTDDAGSTVLPSSYLCSDLGRVVFPKAGTYRLVIESSAGKTAGYSVIWEVSRADQTKSLQAGQTAAGTIDKPGARDLWTMTVPAGTVAYFAADPSCDDSSGEAILWTVTDAKGSPLIGSSFICNDIGRLVFPTAGTYQLVMSSVAGKTAPYSVTWEVSRPDNVKPLQAGQTASGTIDLPGAHDIWTIGVPGPTTIHLAASSSCDAAHDTDLMWDVLDANGSPVVGSSFICDDLGAVSLPAAGTYRILVSSQGGKTGSYSFTWTS